ncbi:MAG: YciI family protein [Chlamydiales bacterium]|nr:YciI family protein [Chlamydiales bacterium]
MPFLIYALDHPNMEKIRETHRKSHREHHKNAGAKVLAAGALLSDDGKEIIGGITLLDVDTKKEANAFMLADPYTKAGIRNEVHVMRWRKRWWNGHFLGEIT